MNLFISTVLILNCTSQQKYSQFLDTFNCQCLNGIIVNCFLSIVNYSLSFMLVYVLLFNARTENEGIHTLQVGEQNIVLMFTDEDDATRFGILLEAQDFPSPTVEAFDSEEIEDFCASTGYECQLIETGMLAVPPENNVDDTDWNPDGKKQPQSASEYSSSELDRIRRQLENLL